MSARAVAQGEQCSRGNRHGGEKWASECADMVDQQATANGAARNRDLEC